MVLKLVRSTALLAFGSMHLVYIGSMSPFPTVFALQYSRVYVSALEDSYIASEVEASIDKSFYFCATL